MKKVLLLCCFIGVLISMSYVFGQMAVPGKGVTGMNVDNVVELQYLTSAEVTDKIKNGWTSVFIPTGGTEIRGPHAIIGVHSILAEHRAIEAAKRIGKVIVAPTLPFAVAATGGYNAQQWKAFEDNPSAIAQNPGAIQVTAETFKGIQQGAAESVMFMGFKDIFLMGDHGGGQQQMAEVVQEMNAKYGSKGVHFYHVTDFYGKTHDDIDMYNYNHKLPIAGHGGMMETAEMMYWEPTPNAFIRPIYKTVPFDGTKFEGPSLEADLAAWKAGKDRQAAGGGRGAGGGGGRGAGAASGDATAAGGGRGAGGGGGRGAGAAADPNAPPRANNGLSGNPHFSTKAIGKDYAEIGITNTVNQVKKMLAEKKGSNQ